MSQNAIKLSAWATKKGLTYKSAWRMFTAGDLPCHSEQLPSGSILVYPDQPSKALGNDRVALYARVCPPKTEEDLDHQLDLLRNFTAAKGFCVDVEMGDVWTGVDLAPRPDQAVLSICKILEDPTIKTVVVENRDRLGPLGADCIEAALKGADKTLIVASKVVTHLTEPEILDVVKKLCEKHFSDSRKSNYVAHRMMDGFRDYKTSEAKILERFPDSGNPHTLETLRKRNEEIRKQRGLEVKIYLKILCEKFPEFISEDTCVEIPSGWFGIFEKLCEEISKYIKDGPEIVIYQVKQKHAALVVYYGKKKFLGHWQDTYLDALIESADKVCCRTCETCGNPGESQEVDSWDTIICQDCYNNHQEWSSRYDQLAKKVDEQTQRVEKRLKAGGRETEDAMIDTPQLLLSSYQKDLICNVHQSVTGTCGENEIFAVRWPRQSGSTQALVDFLMTPARGGHRYKTIFYGFVNSHNAVKHRLHTFGGNHEHIVFVDIAKDIPSDLHKPDLVIVSSLIKIEKGRLKRILQHRGNCTMVFMVSADQYPEIKNHATVTSEKSVADIIAERRKDFEETGNQEFLSYEHCVIRNLPKVMQ